MSTVHFICGPMGAGKTTYAIALAESIKGVRFSIDEWMATLYGKDRPNPCPLEWAVERAARCEALMWTIAEQLISLKTHVVFDVGHARQDERDAFRARVSQTRAEIKMHYLDVDKETRRARVLGRNLQGSGAYFLDITAPTFERMEQYFEPPTDDELYGAMIVVT